MHVLADVCVVLMYPAMFGRRISILADAGAVAAFLVV